MRFLILLSFVLCLVLFSCSEERIVETRSRGFDTEKLDRLNKSGRYDYDRQIESSVNPVLSFFVRIFKAVANLFSNFIGYVVLLALIAIFIYIIVRNSDYFFSHSQDKSLPAVIQKDDEDIKETDYDKLLNEALAIPDYRLAIRYLFLKSLKVLQEKELIDWHKEKTNYQYLNELPQHYRNNFSRLIYYFEYTWYGQFDASAELYSKVVANSEDLFKARRSND